MCGGRAEPDRGVPQRRVRLSCAAHPYHHRDAAAPADGADGGLPGGYSVPPSRYDLTPEQQDNIPLASALHDIGKIGIDEAILNKPGRLTAEEFAVIKTHSMLGAEMLQKTESFADQPLLQTAYEIARWHHERWDGKGYPDGLKGDDIPISAQLVSMADVYDALTSERCYKKAFPHETAVQMITNGECGAFNPLLLQCLLDVQGELKQEILQW